MNLDKNSRASVFKRAFKYSVISSTIILLFVVYRMLVSDVVGTPMEAFLRFVITCISVNLAMYLVFVLYLYFNPDADKPREKD